MTEYKIEEPKPRPIPIWKWILLCFCPVHLGFDTEGDIVCVSFVKILFKHIYIMREDYYCMTTGNLLRTKKLTRKGVSK